MRSGRQWKNLWSRGLRDTSGTTALEYGFIVATVNFCVNSMEQHVQRHFRQYFIVGHEWLQGEKTGSRCIGRFSA